MKLNDLVNSLERSIDIANGTGCQLAKIDIEHANEILSALKNQRDVISKWLMVIADNQLAISPSGFESEKEESYRKGVWDGLEMAYEIISDDIALMAFTKSQLEIKRLKEVGK